MIFIIDTSGSMGEQPIEQARAALLKGLSTHRFNLIQFNSTFECLFDRTVDASVGPLAQAQQYVCALRADGGTEMLPALMEALSMSADGEYLRHILLITDGAVGNEDELMRLIHERLGDARVFTAASAPRPTVTSCGKPHRWAAGRSRSSAPPARSTGA